MDIGRLTATLGIRTEGFTDAEKAMIKLQAKSLEAMNNINQRLEKLEGQLKKVRKESEATAASFDKAALSLKKFGMSMRSLGWLAMTTITLPMVAMGKGALKAAGDFEFAMAKAASKVGDTTTGMMGEWGDKLRSLSKEIGQSAAELASSFTRSLSSDWSKDTSFDIVQRSAKAAAAGLGDVKDITALVNTTMSVYGQSNITAAKTLDVLTRAIHESGAEAEQFTQTIGSVLPFATRFNVQFDEIAGAMAVMTKSGINAANAATYLRNIFMSLIKPSNQSATALKSMGTSIEQLRRTMATGGLMEVLKEIERLSDTFGEDILSLVFPNVRAMMGELMLTGKRLSENEAAMKRVTDSAQAMDKSYQNVADTIRDRLNKVSSTFKDSMIELGLVLKEAILPILEKWAERVSSLVKWFSGLSDGARNAILAFTKFLMVIGPGALVLSTFSLLISNVIKGLGWLIKPLKSATKAMLAFRAATEFTQRRMLITKFGVEGARAILGLKGALVAGGGAMAAAGVAVGGVIYALDKYVKGVKESIIATNVWNTTMVNMGHSLKPLMSTTPEDWMGMPTEEIEKWNKWATESLSNARQWIDYYYRQAGVTVKELRDKYITAILNQDVVDPKVLKEAWRALSGGLLKTSYKAITETKVAEAEAARMLQGATGQALEGLAKQTWSMIDDLPELFRPEQVLASLNTTLKMIREVESQYRSVGLGDLFAADEQRLKAYTEAFHAFAEAGKASHPEARKMATEILRLQAVLDKSKKSLEEFINLYKEIELKMQLLGDAYTGTSDKLKLYTNVFDRLVQVVVEGGKDGERVAYNLAKTLSSTLFGGRMPTDLQDAFEMLITTINELSDRVSVEDIVTEFTEGMKLLGLQSQYAVDGFSAAAEKVELFTNLYNEFLKKSLKAKDVEAFAKEFASKLDPDLFFGDIPDTFEGILKRLLVLIRDYSAAWADEELQRSIDILRQEADAFGDVEVKVELLRRTIQSQRTQMYNYAKQFGTASDQFKKAAANLVQMKQAVVDLEASLDAEYVLLMTQNFGRFSDVMDRLSVATRITEAKIRELLTVTESARGSKWQEDMEKQIETLRKLRAEAEKMDIIQDAVWGLSSLWGKLTDLAGDADKEWMRFVGNVINNIPKIIDLVQRYAKVTGFSTEATMSQLTAEGALIGARNLNTVLGETEVLQTQEHATASMELAIAKMQEAEAFLAAAIAKSSDTAAAAENTIALTGNTVASVANSTVKGGEAVAEATASGAKMPFPYNLIAIALGVGAVIAALRSAIPSPKKMATGGEVPAGYPNDTFPALLTSGEIVIPKGKAFEYAESLIRDRQSKRRLVEFGPHTELTSILIPKLAGGGIIPQGYPNDTFPAMLSSGEMVLPSNISTDIRDIARSSQKIEITVDGKVSGKDLMMVLRRANMIN